MASEMASNSESPLQQIETGGIRLREDERSLVVSECNALAERPLPDAVRVRYVELAEAATTGLVPEELTEALQGLLEIGLESGRFRETYLAHGEMAASRLYARLPRGRLLRESVEAANEALSHLKGHPLGQAELQARGPGRYGLSIEAGPFRIVLRLTRTGVSVETIEATAPSDSD